MLHPEAVSAVARSLTTTRTSILGLSVVLLLAAGAAAAGARHGAPRASGSASNPITIENRLPGTADWHFGEAHPDAIEGYTSEVSVAPGGVVHVHVGTTPSELYQIRVYRLGWYAGKGARQLLCRPSCTGSHQGQAPSTPAPNPTTGELDVNWPVTDTFRVGPRWVTGYYLVELVLRSGADNGSGRIVPLVVRPRTSRRQAIPVVEPVNTWQAYNPWGGKSLYGFNSSNNVPAVRVSFNRPYGSDYQQIFAWDVPLLRFLEREGYDVTYTTDVDIHRNPSEFLRHKLVIFPGHGEYWTKQIRDGLGRAIAAGVNLAFLGADDGSWQMRYDNGERTIVEYRSTTADPEPNAALKTIKFRDLRPPRPECAMRGVESTDGQLEHGEPRLDYLVDPAALSDPWFRGTGFTAASKLAQVVGYEWDSRVPGCGSARTKRLFYSLPPAGRDGAAAVKYTAPSGATVFSAGSLSFSYGLDRYVDEDGKPTPADRRLQRFVRNALDDLRK